MPNPYMATCLRLSKAAKILNLGPQTIRDWHRAGKIRVVRNGKERRIPICEVMRICEERGLGGDFFITLRVPDRGTLELIKALTFRLKEVELVSEDSLESLIVSILAHANGYGEATTQCKTEGIDTAR